MMEHNLVAFSDYSSSSLRDKFGIAHGDKFDLCAIDLVFTYYAARNAAIQERTQRYKVSLVQSARYLHPRLNVYKLYAEDFLKGTDKNSRDPLRLAVICGDKLLGRIKAENLMGSGMTPAEAKSCITDARKIQQQANFIRESSDLDYRPVRLVDTAKPSRMAAFLAHIDLFSKVADLRYSVDLDHDTLSEHLRYDIICAPRYLDTDTEYGYALTAALDQWEDEIVAQLVELSPLIRIEAVHAPADVIAFPGPRM